VASVREESSQPFQFDTICSLASMTKLLTSVACMQAVEAGMVDLDKPVSEILPEVGKYGILTGFDDEKDEGIYEQHKTPVTLRYGSIDRLWGGTLGLIEPDTFSLIPPVTSTTGSTHSSQSGVKVEVRNHGPALLLKTSPRYLFFSSPAQASDTAGAQTGQGR
jgi:hypothetical protein